MRDAAHRVGRDSLTPHLTHRDRDVYETGQPLGKGFQGGEFRRGVSGIYRDEPERLDEQRVVVVEVPCNIGVCSRGRSLPDKRASGAPKYRTPFYPSCGDWLCDE